MIHLVVIEQMDHFLSIALATAIELDGGLDSNHICDLAVLRGGFHLLLGCVQAGDIG